MLRDVIGDLICAVCGRGVALAGRAVSCDAGHSFDVARQGYVSMLGGGSPHRGDSAAMVEARARFLAGGRFDPIAAAVAAASSGAGAGCVVDAGAGTGYYLARVLDVLPDRAGIALDASAPALRRAARCRPRAGAVACDVWSRLPVRTGAAGALLNVFAPRNGGEMHRVLAVGGLLVVVTPTDRHLHELVGPLGLVGVDDAKEERVEQALGRWFDLVASHVLEYGMEVGEAEAADLVAMGPSARHRPGDPPGLPDEQVVTASVRVATYRPHA